MVLEKTPESSLDSKEIKPVNLKGTQLCILIGRTNAEAEAPVFWSSDVNSQLIGKVPDAGKEWGQKEKRASEDEMASWHHWCNEHELGQTSGDGKGQGGLVCYSPWCCKESDTTGWLNNKNNIVLCWVLVAQLCPTLCDPMDFSPPGSSVHGIFQAKSLEWVAILYLQIVKNCNGSDILSYLKFNQ